jgi:general secretion pathway protein C
MDFADKPRNVGGEGRLEPLLFLRKLVVFTEVKTLLSRPIVPKVSCFILVLLLVWQITSGIRGLFLLDKALVVSHDSSVKEKIKTEQGLLTMGLSAAFFGDYVPKTLNDSGVKQSMLDLTVVGIMFSDEEGESHVIIRTATGVEKTFYVGDSLPGGALIKRITLDGVLIQQKGSLESLIFPKNALIFEPPPKPLETSK